MNIDNLLVQLGLFWQYPVITEKTFYEQKNLSLNDAYALCSKVMTMNMLKEEAKEGIEAFLDKREPNWDLEND